MKKHYLSRRETKFWSSDMPIGDPTGGAAYGEMNDPVTATIASGVGGGIGALASYKGAQLQADAAQHAADIQAQQFNTINKQQAPWRQAGATALAQLGLMTGPDGQLVHQFNANDLNANLAPNYQFMLQQGQGQVGNLANATGGLVSGNALQGLNKFTQDYAQNAYQQAFQNYTANQSNIFNRLSSIAGLGQTANQATAQAGMNAANQMGNYVTQGAAAQAGGLAGIANAANQGIQNYMGYNYLNSLRPQQTWTTDYSIPMTSQDLLANPQP